MANNKFSDSIDETAYQHLKMPCSSALTKTTGAS